ncbi:MAG TPA: DNA-binding transcriptional regulator [Desulfuromonadaceae bacterium]|nr:DNA-binding transcriptional regulator [Desulfuromonadaceae bacterium]
MNRTVPNGHRPRVALLIESSRAYGRGLLLGVAKYVRQHGPWSISLQEQSLCDVIPDWLYKWKGDGIITRLDNRNMAKVIRRLRVPTIYLRNAPPGLHAPMVMTNNLSAARLAFEHLRERGFRHFAFCGFDGADYSDTRRENFIRLVVDAGLRCHVFENPVRRRRGRTIDFERDGMREGELLVRWLRQLPRPVGLMACNDMRGQQVLDACRAAGLGVPDDVGVVGVDNDEVLCDLSDPPLSSVVPDTERIGFEAAALLDEMMAGKEAPRAPVYVDPRGVVARSSTEVLAIEDRHMTAALRFVRERACEGIDVGDLVRAIPLSRSALERRFIKVIGRSPKEEIMRVRLNRAKQLLAETNFSIEFIAEKIGFERAEYLSRIFKKKTGMTPFHFRRQSRG